MRVVVALARSASLRSLAGVTPLGRLDRASRSTFTCAGGSRLCSDRQTFSVSPAISRFGAVKM